RGRDLPDLRLRLLGRRGPHHRRGRAGGAAKIQVRARAPIHGGSARRPGTVSAPGRGLFGRLDGGRRMNTIRNLGAAALNAIERLGRATLFLYEILAGAGPLARRFFLVVQQVYAVGVLTLLIILVSGLFVGMVLGLQGYNTLVRFGAEESLGLLVALSLVRELGPVVTALLFAGRAGSALTAEIGL